MRIKTLALGMHTAFLDVMTGSGLLVFPPDSAEVSIGTDSILQADWHAAVRSLHVLGWTPSDDEDGCWIVEGMTADGHMVIGLFGQHPVISDPSLDECIEAFAELHTRVGLIPTQRRAA